MPQTTAIENDVRDAFVDAIGDIDTRTPEEVFTHVRSDFSSLPVPSAFVVLDASTVVGRVDDRKRWETSIWVCLVDRPETIAEMKAWVENAIEADETLGGAGYNVQHGQWDYGYPVGKYEGTYAWCETVFTFDSETARGKNIEAA